MRTEDAAFIVVLMGLIGFFFIMSPVIWDSGIMSQEKLLIAAKRKVIRDLKRKNLSDGMTSTDGFGQGQGEIERNLSSADINIENIDVDIEDIEKYSDQIDQYLETGEIDRNQIDQRDIDKYRGEYEEHKEELPVLK